MQARLTPWRPRPRASTQPVRSIGPPFLSAPFVWAAFAAYPWNRRLGESETGIGRDVSGISTRRLHAVPLVHSRVDEFEFTIYRRYFS